jgi:hypothetical protein
MQLYQQQHGPPRWPPLPGWEQHQCPRGQFDEASMIPLIFSKTFCIISSVMSQMTLFWQILKTKEYELCINTRYIFIA